jgi:hypothetical protein
MYLRARQEWRFSLFWKYKPAITIVTPSSFSVRRDGLPVLHQITGMELFLSYRGRWNLHNEKFIGK